MIVGVCTVAERESLQVDGNYYVCVRDETWLAKHHSSIAQEKRKLLVLGEHQDYDDMMVEVLLLGEDWMETLASTSGAC